MSKSSPIPTNVRLRRHLWLAIAMAGLAAPLAGCGANQSIALPEVSSDYHIEHPIILARHAQVLDVFPVGAYGRLDSATAARVKEFAHEYAESGEGRISIMVPSGTGYDTQSRNMVPALRHALYRGGAHGSMSIGSYPIEDNRLAAPIRLSFAKLAARVANKCGEWPSDLANGSGMESFQNRPYHNFGCAVQNEMAVEVADPRDLVNPAAETPPDTSMRVRAITAVREGKDPSTSWSLKNSTIGTLGAN